MCFCAKASFIAAMGLLTIGILALRKSHSFKSRLLAMIPLFFAVQQSAEGMIWISYDNLYGDMWGQIFSFIFLVFAFGLWPIWIPFCVLMHERKAVIKKILFVFLMAGIALSSVLMYYLLVCGVYPLIHDRHIEYVVPVQANSFTFNVLLAWYLVVTIGSFFVSSIRSFHYFGFLLALSSLVSMYFGRTFFISIWCFFAALLSLAVFWLVQEPTET